MRKFFSSKQPSAGATLLAFAVTLLAGLTSTNAFAAKVTGISSKKKMVKIDEGSSTGFKKGASVCFFGKKNKKVGCGKVSSAKEDSAIVKVSAKRLKAIKKGMPARLGGKSPKTEIATGTDTGSTATENVKALPSQRMAFKMGYVISALTPSVYNKLTYLAPELNDAGSPEEQSTLWKSEGANSLSIFGFYGEFEFPIGKSHALSVGLRYTSYRPFIAQADYDKTALNLYVESEQEATAMGFYTDYTYLNLDLSGGFRFRMSTGLDIDMSTMKFKATMMDGNGEAEETEIATATSKLSVVSWRLLNSQLDWQLFDSLGITIIGINTLIPLTTFGAGFGGSFDDPNAEYLSGGDTEADLKEAIGHKKNSAGIELFFGGYLSF